jgi:phage-related minor tail protein
MAQSVGDLVVNLDVDSAKFTEQVNYVNKQLKGTGKAANDAALQVQQAFSKQELAAKRAGISVGQYGAAMRTLPAQFTDIATQLAGGQSPGSSCSSRADKLRTSLVVSGPCSVLCWERSHLP